MRFLHLYLIGYFVLVVGAGLALWQGGVLARVPPSWLLLVAIIVVGLGVLLVLTSVRSPAITRRQ